MRKKVSLGSSGINVCVVKGDLKQERSDVIVCATSRHLDLTKGRIAREILRAAGNQVQLDCNQNHPDGIQSDEIAVANSGNLPCQKIFFVALRPWGRGTDLKDFKVVVNKCLDAASKSGFDSISFPALGTGLLKYPADKVAHTTLQCVEDFSNNNNNNNNTSLKYVNIIIFHRDYQIYTAFRKEARARARSNEVDGREVLSTSYRSIPSYWSAEDTSCVKKYRVIVDRKTFEDVEAVVTSTWLSQFVGHGRDGVGLKNYSSIEVVKIERIQNVQLYSKYARSRQTLRRKVRSGTSFELLENIAGSGGEGVMTMDSVSDRSTLAADLIPEVNETYLFHGTLKENIDAIAERGLQLGSESSMFGKGVYAAESSTKADQYSDPKLKRDIKGEKQMFLVRACLGRIYLAKSARKFVGIPCADGCEDQCCCEQSNFCDSVVANGHWNFREFVVFDSCQVYPEYLITYKRV